MWAINIALFYFYMRFFFLFIYFFLRVHSSTSSHIRIFQRNNNKCTIKNGRYNLLYAIPFHQLNNKWSDTCTFYNNGNTNLALSIIVKLYLKRINSSTNNKPDFTQKFPFIYLQVALCEFHGGYVKINICNKNESAKSIVKRKYICGSNRFESKDEKWLLNGRKICENKRLIHYLSILLKYTNYNRQLIAI